MISKHSHDIEPERVVHLHENIEKNVDEDISETFQYEESEITKELSEQSSEQSELHIPTIEEFKTALIESSSAFVAKLNRQPNMTKSITKEVIHYTTDLFNSNFIDILKRVHGNYREHDNSQLCSEMLNAISNPFHGLETVYKGEKYLEKAGYRIKPAAFSIRSEVYPKKNRRHNDRKVKRLNWTNKPT